MSIASVVYIQYFIAQEYISFIFERDEIYQEKFRNTFRPELLTVRQAVNLNAGNLSLYFAKYLI